MKHRAKSLDWHLSYPVYLIALTVLCSLSFIGHSEAQTNAILINGDFETGDIAGWEAQGTTAVIKDQLDALTLNSLHTVGEGVYSARIGDEIPWGTSGPQTSMLAQEVVVPPEGSNAPVLQFAYAVVANDPPSHPEPEKPFFRVVVTDQSTGQPLYDTDVVFTSQTSGKWYLGSGPGGNSLFSAGSGDRWVFQAWTPVVIDLDGLEGHRIRVEFNVRDCNPSAHAAYGYLDAVRVGPEQEIVLPPLEGDPKVAPFIKPNLLGRLFGLAEHLGDLWWLGCCLAPLLLLFAPLLIRRAARRSADSGGWWPPQGGGPTRGEDDGGGGLRPSDGSEYETVAGGLRPPGEESHTGLGGFRPPDEHPAKPLGSGGFRPPEQ